MTRVYEMHSKGPQLLQVTHPDHQAHLQDPKKRKWVDSLAADVVYVSGRKRPAGEMNGKSGNINNVCSQLYPPGTVVPGNELICIFDADQVGLSQTHYQPSMP